MCTNYDGKGNVSALIDSAQAVVASYAYDPFGKLMKKSGIFDQPYTFSTKEAQSGTGQYYYGYRFYDSCSGKWSTRDPLGEAADLNVYRMVGNSAMNLIDPFGLYESHWLLRSLVPGQVAWDTAVTAFENQDYVGAGVNASVMVGEQVLTVLTLGEGKAAQQCISKARQNIANNWFRYDPAGRWKTGGVWQEGAHIHVDPIPGSNRLMKHHLPDQIQTWWGHLKAIIRERIN